MTAAFDLRTALSAATVATGSPSSDYDLNPDVRSDPKQELRASAVLVPIEDCPEGPRLWLTRRSAQLRHHPGQIAFPGGKQDAGDATLTATALREAREEIGLLSSQVEILGTLPSHETVTHFNITPVLGMIRDGFEPTLDFGEVSEVFHVPLAHVLDPAKYVVEGRMWNGARRAYYAVPHGPQYIWGATARILRVLADRIVS